MSYVLSVFAPTGCLRFGEILASDNCVMGIVPKGGRLVRFEGVTGRRLGGRRCSGRGIVGLFGGRCSIVCRGEISRSCRVPLRSVGVFTSVAPLLFRMSGARVSFGGLGALAVSTRVFIKDLWHLGLSI